MSDDDQSALSARITRTAHESMHRAVTGLADDVAEAVHRALMSLANDAAELIRRAMTGLADVAAESVRRVVTDLPGAPGALADDDAETEA